jgi:hypothetical protein
VGDGEEEGGEVGEVRGMREDRDGGRRPLLEEVRLYRGSCMTVESWQNGGRVVCYPDRFFYTTVHLRMRYRSF